MATGKQGGARRTAERVSVGLGESYAGLGKFIDLGSSEVVGPVTTGVQGALVVGQENYYVGAFLTPSSPKNEEKGQACQWKGNDAI
jgi:hypothetical protein